ncbi:uncharacterized protein LOC115709921 [Cannabis sativa]|uniref:uncharacterized protein LOC115709921 n=1 Tax=Cannabis sativa TaxID=3483 RepID=UPI0029CA3750|nr:uncharacterized protein LOC115709921 [Cannabis sativa]
MDSRGGCCIARYVAGGGGGGVYGYDMSKVGRIMLRFRPIAPKPVAGGPVSGGNKAEMGETQARGGRGKRRIVKDNNNNTRRCNIKKRNASSPESSDEKRRRLVPEEKVVTLPLLPETPEPKDTPARLSPETRDSPKWLSFENNNNVYGSGRLSVETADPTAVKTSTRPVKLVGSSVTVECVTDTWMDGINKFGLGCTDDERRMNLAQDTCPGFVSDSYGRVTWTNGAYKKLVGQGCEDHDLHHDCSGGDDHDQMMMMVWLVMKERLPVTVLTCPAFTCRVRLQCYTNGNKEIKSSLTLPCDVWRMDCGGFAWRLDVNAALCLGR